MKYIKINMYYYHQELMDNVINENLKMVQYYLKNGADPNISTTKYYDFPLINAIEQQHLEIVKELLKYNANPNETGITGISPLALACHYGNYEIFMELLKYTIPSKNSIYETWENLLIEATSEVKNKKIIKYISQML